jgi:hypothetical protein
MLWSSFADFAIADAPQVANGGAVVQLGQDLVVAG